MSRCPHCGACKECGARVVPMPYPPPYVRPGPWWYRGGLTSGGTTMSPPTFTTNAGGQYQ